ncbi:hypothetical protein BLNAU_22331 [Blattamonas nauphoetae]|uniref:Uncharacterized protein n=1 Tax=Blattamonas nauphoetae TaxID=2049346 RepID=A0ABQ9WTC1_9EUKA|nr:hypothetical protein BLNAU_22331 [Blattamonas nauphoetae]
MFGIETIGRVSFVPEYLTEVATDLDKESLELPAIHHTSCSEFLATLFLQQLLSRVPNWAKLLNAFTQTLRNEAEPRAPDIRTAVHPMLLLNR